MRWSVEGRARISASVAASNRRRGEQDPLARAARRAYRVHRNNAKHRDIVWRISFLDWWLIWLASGKWEHRGKHSGEYCLSRYGDMGAYEVGNVYVNLSSVNMGDGNRGKNKPLAQRRKMSATAVRRPRRSNGTFEGWSAELDQA